MADLITVHIFTFPTEAQIAKAKLEDSGIECYLLNENLVQVIGLYSNALGGVKLQVSSQDFEQARQILLEGGIIPSPETQTINKKIELLNEANYPDKTKCPYCQSENIDTVVNPNILVVIFYFILGVIFPIFKSWEKCYDCGKEWKYKKVKNK
jgi:hypothetical protein